ncbi:hypothetical protein ASPFODRAFT_519003 [Aspergillus luchuensis CBS 106.47]|uniref:Uncharacterized protein n=1 Tax=Aspergillus luchuensis (strain CBS 106.47) TaxID=1137211 RepID=A0A1M3SZF7_ASPLC|nr:hypothetical protein ASPFODRAFT_519003 [Aspergillus luchuensis CBS 106.47]
MFSAWSPACCGLGRTYCLLSIYLADSSSHVMYHLGSRVYEVYVSSVGGHQIGRGAYWLLSRPLAVRIAKTICSWCLCRIIKGNAS